MLAPAGGRPATPARRVVDEMAAATLVATRLPISRGTRPMIATTSGSRTDAAARFAPAQPVDQHPAQVEQQQRGLGGGLQEAVARDDAHGGRREARKTPAERGSPVSTDISPNASPGPSRERTVSSPDALWRKTSTSPDSMMNRLSPGSPSRTISLFAGKPRRSKWWTIRVALSAGMPRKSGLARTAAPP